MSIDIKQKQNNIDFENDSCHVILENSENENTINNSSSNHDIDNINLSEQSVDLPETLSEQSLCIKFNFESEEKTDTELKDDKVNGIKKKIDEKQSIFDFDEIKNKPIDIETKILDDYRKMIEARTAFHFGYPYNLKYNHEELMGFMRYTINNLGDPFISSNYGVHSRPFEMAVLDFFARLQKIEKPNYWGYVTTSGTEGNLHGLLVAREVLPNAILFASSESHYSVFKAARFYKIPVVQIKTLYTGEIDCNDFEAQLKECKPQQVIINVNIGTTVKGAVDDLHRILRILNYMHIDEKNFYVHCDGALCALMLPFIKYSPEVSFKIPVDSISVSGHKFLGCPMPCGVIITRKEHIERIESDIEYLNSKDTTIMGSRNGQAPIFLQYTLRKKNCEGILADVRLCIKNSRYLRDKLKEAGVSCMLNDLSTTVVFRRPNNKKFIQKWQLACQRNLAHVVVMPNVTRRKIDLFVNELIDSGALYENDDCLRQELGFNNCKCSLCLN